MFEKILQFRQVRIFSLAGNQIGKIVCEFLKKNIISWKSALQNVSQEYKHSKIKNLDFLSGALSHAVTHR